MIASDLVGLFIGAGGGNIKAIKDKLGGGISISVMPPVNPGDMQAIRIVGDHIELARELVRTKVEELQRGNPMMHSGGPMGGGAGGTGTLQVRPSDAEDIQIAEEMVGPLIGSGGHNLKEIKANAGGSVFISVLPSADVAGPRTVRIAGDHRDQAKALIMAKLVELRKLGPRPPAFLAPAPSNPSAQWWQAEIEDPADTIQVPAEIISAFVGPGGVHLKEIKARSGGAVTISVQAQQPGCMTRDIRVQGEHKDFARELLEMRVQELLAASRPQLLLNAADLVPPGYGLASPPMPSSVPPQPSLMVPPHLSPYAHPPQA